MRDTKIRISGANLFFDFRPKIVNFDPRFGTRLSRSSIQACTILLGSFFFRFLLRILSISAKFPAGISTKLPELPPTKKKQIGCTLKGFFDTAKCPHTIFKLEIRKIETSKMRLNLAFLSGLDQLVQPG